MRIVYVVSQYPCLSETFVAREMAQLVQLGQEIIICPLRPPGKALQSPGIEVPGVKILRSPVTPRALLAAQSWLFRRNFSLWVSCWTDVFGSKSNSSRLHHLSYILLVTTWLARYLQNVQVNHIRGHFLHSEALSSMWLARMLAVPYSLTVHTAIIKYPFSLIAKTVKEAAFVVSDIQEALTLVRRIRPHRTYLIRNGIDLSELLPRSGPVTPVSPPRILAVGRLRDGKGFDVLLKACAQLERMGIIYSCRLIGEGDERATLERMVRDLGLGANVEMPGSLSFGELLEEYAAATVLVMPCKDSPVGGDGLPTVVIESLALGLPVVATRKAGIPDLVKDQETGLLVKPNDPSQLAECIAALLNNGNLRERLAQAGRKMVQKEFDIHKTVPQLVDLITERVD